jgi:hypothetical protein
MMILHADAVNSRASQPDGSFRILPENYSYWSQSGFFQITLGYGTFSFAQAKLVDVSWDVVSSSMCRVIAQLNPSDTD